MTVLPQDAATRYRLGEELGRGAFGAVYRAVHVEGGPEVALKILAADHDPERFAREVEALRRIDHPHVLRCLDAGEGWLALELASGTAVDLWRDPARSEEAWEGLAAAARGVAALHEAGIAHRDLKPENLLRVGDRWVVADLGLARLADLETLTRTGMVQGTPRYMAPEQARGEKPGPPADVWALGVMAYELVEGRSPWPAEDAPLDTLMRLARGERPGWARGADGLSPEVLAALQAALSPEPGERPEDLVAWAELLTGEEPQAGTPETLILEGERPLTPEGTTIRRRPGPASPGGRRRLVAFAVGLAAGGWWLLGEDPGGPRDAPVAPDPVEALVTRAEADLDRWLEGPVVDGAGRPVGPGPEATRSLRMLSPVHAAELAARLESLGELEEEFAAGYDTATAPSAALAALRRLDGRFRKLGLPSPVHPMAKVLAEEPPSLAEGEVPEVVRSLSVYWLAREPPAAPPRWLAAGLRALGRRLAATEARRREESAFQRGELEAAWPDSVRNQLRAQRLRMAVSGERGLESPLSTLSSSIRSPTEAGEVWHHYRAELEAAEEVAYALQRAAREEPEGQELALNLLHEIIFDPDDLVLHPVRMAGRDFPPVPVDGAGPGASLADRIRRAWTLKALREAAGIKAPEAIPSAADLEALVAVVAELQGDGARPALLVLALRMLRRLVVWRAESGAGPQGWPNRLRELESRSEAQLDSHHSQRLWENQVKAIRRHVKWSGGLAPELREYVAWLAEHPQGNSDPKAVGRLRDLLEP